METKIFLPNNITEKLKCDLCHGYLSVSPITTLDGKISCGRCNPGWPRNTVYEELAQFMIFPCFYCEEHLHWREVKQHELTCRQNVILCPAKFRNNANGGEYHKSCQNRRIVCPFDLCHIAYEVKNIWTHFNKYHKDYIFTNTVEARKIMKEEKVWNFNPDTHVCLVTFRLMPFLLFVHSVCTYDESTGDIISYDYFFSVFSLCKENCDFQYLVTVTLNSESDAATFSMSNQEIKPYNEKLHCINYLRIGLIRYNSFNSFNFMTTRFEKLQKSKDLKLSYNIQLTENLETKPINEKPKKDNFLWNVDSLTKSLECPICKDYLYPPVFNCHTGHTFCRKCREQLVTCPFCQAIIGNSRNFVLEDILETLQLSCQNEYKGCHFIGTVQEIKLHELACAYN